MKKLLFFLISIITLTTFAQGSIEGLILDSEIENSPLPFADVYIKGTTKGTTTDFDGNFEISNVDAGNYTLIIGFVGYESKELTVTVVDGVPTRVKETLKASAASLGEIIITSTTSVKESEKSILIQQKKADVIIESIGSEELSRKAVSDAAAAVTKISGISKQEGGGNNVYVRGLGDRYLNTTLNGLPLPSNDIEKKNIDLNLFSSDIIQNIGVSKTYSSEFYGDFGAGNINVNSKEHSGKAFFNIEVGSKINTEAITQQTLRGESTGFAGFYRRHSINPFNVSVSDPVDPIGAESNAGLLARLSFGNKWELNDDSSLSVFGSASFDSGYEFREGPAVDFTTVKRFSVDRSNEYEYNRTTSLIGSVVYKINADHKVKFASLYINDATDEVGYYGLDGNGINRDAIIDTDKGFFVSNTQFDQNTIVVNQLIGKSRLNDKLKLNWAAGYNKVLARQPDRRRFAFEQFNSLLDTDPSTNATFFNNTSFDNQRYFQNIIDDEINARLAFNYKLNENVIFDLGFNYRNKERDFENIRYGFDFDGNRVEVDSVTNLNGVINENNFGRLFDLVVFNTEDRLASNTNRPGLSENAYNGKLDVKSAYINTKFKFGGKTTVVPGIRFENFEQEITYDAINLSPLDPRFQKASEFFFLPNVNAKYTVKEDQNIRLSASRTVSNPEFKEVAPYIYEDVTERVGGNPDLLGDTPFSDIYNIDAKYEYFLSPGELLSLSVFGKQINDPINKVITSDATGVQRFFRTGNKAKVLGVEIEAKKNLLKNEQEDVILTGGLNLSYIHTKQDLKDVTSNVPGGFNTSFNKSSDELQGSSPFIINADITFKPNVGKFKPQATLIYSQFSDRIYALGAGALGNIIEKSVPTLDFVWKNSFTKNIDFSLSVKNIINPKIKRVREEATGNVLLTSYQKGLNIGFQFKYNF